MSVQILTLLLACVCADHRIPAIRPLRGLVGVRCTALRDAGWTGEARFPYHHHYKRSSHGHALTVAIFITVEEVFWWRLVTRLHFTIKFVFNSFTIYIIFLHLLCAVCLLLEGNNISDQALTF